MEGALYAVLGGLARYLEYSEQALADVFQQRGLETGEEPSDIADILGRLTCGWPVNRARLSS